MLPNITRNDSELQSLRNKTLKVEQTGDQETRILPKILLLSQKRDEFYGLQIPAEGDLDKDRRDNAKKIREEINQMEKEKNNELYLEWLERNQDTVDTVNKKLSL